MRASVASPATQTELNKVQPRMAKARTEQNFAPTAEETTEIDAVPASTLSLIETARRRANLKLDYLATLPNNPSKPQLSATLHGVGSFNVSWLDSWPQEFWDEYLPLQRAEREQSPAAVRARKAERLKSAIGDLIDLVEAAS